jgi:hypothetical protein
MNCLHFGFCCWIWWPSFLRSKNCWRTFVAGPRIHFGWKMDNDGRRIDAEFNGNSTRHHSNMLHYSGQGHWQRTHHSLQRCLSCLPFLHDCFISKLPTIHSRIHPTHSERKQDFTPTNQNTRSSTRRHSTSCILVPHHDYARGIQPRRLKSPILSICTLLDPFYPRHFAFPFGLPAVPYRRSGPNVQNTISSSTHSPNPSSRVHSSSHVTVTATLPGQYRI